MKYNKVVFIDPGTKFGFAIANNVETFDPFQLSSGASALPSEPGPKVMEFWKKLHDIVGTKEPVQTLVAWEEAAFTFNNPRQERWYGTWEGVLLLFCELYKIPYMSVHNSTIKACANHAGYFDRRKPKPRKSKDETAVHYHMRVKAWSEDKNFDKKPRPRKEWKLTSAPDLQEHEIDSRWGLELVLNKLK